jgi:hypothetical protein
VGEHDLAGFQRFVADAIRGTSAIDGRADVSARARELVAPSARGMTSEQRLEVYREQFWARHLKNVEEDYPTLIHAVGGREAFRELAIEYLGTFPPCTWDLQRLGANVPRFVASHDRWGRDALACDAARLDRAFMEAFDVPDAEPIDPRVLASTPEEAWPAARLAFHPSLRLLALDHPVHEMRERIVRGVDAGRPAASRSYVVVYRDQRCFLRSLAIEPPAFELLESLCRDVPLGEACEAVARASGADPLDLGSKLGAWFQQWTTNGWITAARCHDFAK